MVKKTVLQNGLRVLLVPTEGSLAATVLILVEAGSEYETKNINGLSHFLEHMMFKGTTNRPEPGVVAKELDSLGAQYNAFTGQEYTGYWAKVESGKVGRAIDIVSDLYLNPIFNPGEIDKERGVVIEEINLYEDTPMRRVQELFTSLLYGDQPAGWDIAGRKEVIRAVTREDFLKYRGLHYVAPKTIVVIAGNFNQEKVRAQLSGLFGNLKRERVIKKHAVSEHQTKPEVLVSYKKSDQSHLVLGVRAFSIFDNRRYALQVLANVLGGGMSSRLFQKVREELGAAYYIRAEADLAIDHGYLSISSGVDHLKIKKVITAALHELQRLRKDLVPSDELQKSKDHLTGNLMLSLESSDELASYYGGQEVMTRSIVNPKELVQKIQAVTAKEVKTVAQAIVTNAKLNLAVIGPYRSPNVFKGILTLESS